MIKSVSPSFPLDPDEGKSGKSEKPDTAAFKKAIEESESVDPNAPKGKSQPRNKKPKTSHRAAQKTKSSSQTKGDNSIMSDSPKKIEGHEHGKNKKTKPPSTQPPKKEEFSRLKESLKKTTESPKPAAKPSIEKPPKPETTVPKPENIIPKIKTAKPSAQLKPEGKKSLETLKSLEKPFELPETLKQAVLALKNQEKPGEETAIVQPSETEAQAKGEEKVTEKDLVEIFQKAQQDVPQARAVAAEIREKYPEKAKELEKFIKKEIPKLKSELEKTKKAGIKTQTSPFEELTASKAPKKPPETLQSPFTTFNLPQDIRAQAISIASPVENILPTEMIPLFTHMVGTLIHMEKQGISTTQIVLNNPEFSASRFYGTKVTFDRFSTAPNSYNIRFTGSEEAVTIIKQNVDGLYKAFSNADVDFKVNDIRAEHEPMMFKRKPSVGKDQEGGV